MLSYYREISIDGKIIVTKATDVGVRAMRKKLPKHLKRKQLFWNSKTGEYYYHKEVVVGVVKYLGAYKDKACTIKKRI